MKIKILVFDFDGTIADTFLSMVEISNHLAMEFNFKRIEPHQINFFKDKTSLEMLKLLQVPTLKVPRIATRAKNELNKKITHIKPVNGLQDILKKIHSLGYQMGILSSNSLENVNKFLKTNQLDLFDFVLTSSRFWGKNFGLKKMIEKQGFNAKEVLYIGDETRDIDAARKSGIHIAAVTWGYNSLKVLKKYQPDYLIHSPEELLQLCLKHNPLEKSVNIRKKIALKTSIPLSKLKNFFLKM